MPNEYWIGDEAWSRIELLIPMDRRGVKPGNNRRVIKGILHVLKYGCHWRDCPPVGRSRGGRMTKLHAVADAAGRLIAFALSAGQMGDIRFAMPLLSGLPSPAHLLSDTAYDGNAFRDFLLGRSTIPVIRPNPTRSQLPPFDEARCGERNVVERCFSHLKDWRRVATRYDKLTRTFNATVCLAVILIWWT